MAFNAARAQNSLTAPRVCARSGTGYPMLPHPVVNKAPNPTKEEPFCVVRDNLISGAQPRPCRLTLPRRAHLAGRRRAEMLVHDAERLANPQDVLNRVVYDCIEPNPNTFTKGGAAGGAAAAAGDLPPYYTKTDPADTTLIFESRFECGNLRRCARPPASRNCSREGRCVHRAGRSRCMSTSTT